MGSRGRAGRARAWISENRLLILGGILAAALLALHVDGYHAGPSVEDALDAVVVIHAGTGMGTGFFIDKNGCLLTAAHVVDGAKDGLVTIRMRGDIKVYPAKVVAAARPLDIAIVCAQGVKPKRWLAAANTENIERGTAVYALGHPAGRLWNVTNGVVSRTGYKMHTADGKSWFPRYDMWVSCFISWGNSGGPLINRNGAVVGMVVEWDDPGIGRPNNMNIAVPGTDLLRFIRTSLGR